MQDISKQLLTQNAAGMRLIAQMTLYNSGNFQRLKTYIAENYHPALLEEQSGSALLALLKAQWRVSGKVRVRQVIAVDIYQVVVLIESENNEGLSFVDLAVEEEYPHRVTRFDQKSTS